MREHLPRLAPADQRLADLARRVARLAPSHRDPERYFTDKSEIVAELRRLAREARHGAGGEPVREPVRMCTGALKANSRVQN